MGPWVLNWRRWYQTMKAPPYRIPVSEPLGQRPPSNVVNGKEVQRLKKQAIILRLRTPPRQAKPENLQRNLPVRIP